MNFTQMYHQPERGRYAILVAEAAMIIERVLHLGRVQAGTLVAQQLTIIEEITLAHDAEEDSFVMHFAFVVDELFEQSGRVRTLQTGERAIELGVRGS